VLIGAGVILLLSNLGYLPWQSWNILWRLWPLLLVAIGIDLLIGRRSMVGAIVSGLLILLLIGGAVALVFFAQNIPAWVELAQPVELRTEHVEYPLADMERASVTIDWTSAPGYLSVLRDSPNLIEGDVTYRGQLIFDVDVRGDRADVKLDSHYTGPWFGLFDFEDRAEERWDVRLSPKVSLDLTLDAGSGPCDFDLTWTAAPDPSPSSCPKAWAPGWCSIRAAAPSAPTSGSGWWRASATMMVCGRRTISARQSTPSCWK